MKVLILSPRPHLLTEPILVAGDDYEISMEEPRQWPRGSDWVVSFGYRHIIKEPYLSMYRGRMVNIHMSVLPWNRGADPNFWSWFDGTPKGVTIHFIDPGPVDTGRIILQSDTIDWPENTTLRSSYDYLMIQGAYVFSWLWPRLREGKIRLPTIPNGLVGTYHRSSDKNKLMAQLPLGWDTPVTEVEKLGGAMSYGKTH